MRRFVGVKKLSLPLIEREAQQPHVKPLPISLELMGQ